MDTELRFKPNYYKITKLWEPNVLEVEDTWFIRLKGIGDNTPKEELKKWLRKGNIVRVVPYWRSNDARIVSDVWLGNTHINRQFPNYERDNLIQTFNRWHDIRENHNLETIKAEEKLSEAFNTAWGLIPNKLQKTVTKWIKYCLLEKRDGAMPAGTDKMPNMKKQLIDQMIKNFNEWRKHG